MAVKAYLEITLFVKPENRAAAAAVYSKYRQPFIDTIPGAETKQLLVCNENVQVLHGFDSKEHARSYLQSKLFTGSVAPGLSPLWFKDPVITVYEVAA
jgi:hypothetical protein